MSPWLNGWIMTAPVVVEYSCAAAMLAPTSTPTSSISAPYPWVACTLGSAAPSGMKMRAGMPSIWAARATPWAWLPADAATTPAARSDSERREMRV